MSTAQPEQHVQHKHDCGQTECAFAIGPTKYTLPLQLSIGSIQAGLVAYHFMHLKQGDKVVILTALSSLFWMGILFVLFLSDYMTRNMLVG